MQGCCAGTQGRLTRLGKQTVLYKRCIQDVYDVDRHIGQASFSRRTYQALPARCTLDKSVILDILDIQSIQSILGILGIQRILDILGSQIRGSVCSAQSSCAVKCVE